jgi:hypothetical protein
MPLKGPVSGQGSGKKILRRLSAGSQLRCVQRSFVEALVVMQIMASCVEPLDPLNSYIHMIQYDFEQLRDPV